MLHSDSICVIGNGPSAINSDNRKFIDSCDAVIRFNKFYITGYEDQVGNKITHWCISSGCKVFYGELEFVRSLNKEVKLICIQSLFPKRTNRVLNAAKANNVSASATSLDITKKAVDTSGVHPSTGIMLLYYLCNIFDDTKTFYVTGFDVLYTGIKRHYWRGRSPWGFHDLEAERRLMYPYMHRLIKL